MAGQRDEILAEVSLGVEAEAFLGSAVGKYLVKVAEEEREVALNELKTVDPMDAGRIRELQGKVWRAESVQTWIAEIIQAGWNAETAITLQDAVD